VQRELDAVRDFVGNVVTRNGIPMLVETPRPKRRQAALHAVNARDDLQISATPFGNKPSAHRADEIDSPYNPDKPVRKLSTHHNQRQNRAHEAGFPLQ
jgi:hypothetical protein